MNPERQQTSEEMELALFKRNYSLEFGVAAACIAFSAVLWFAFVSKTTSSSPELGFFSLASAGFLFVAGQMYGRLKDRRDSRRKRAHDLFLEWHSKDVRTARVYVSRWVEVHNYTRPPSLSSIEKEAANYYRKRYGSHLETCSLRTDYPGTQQTVSVPIVVTSQSDVSPDPANLNDPEQMEFHFFAIYQFFERWAMLEINDDIDHYFAVSYMGTYTKWYREMFLDPWLEAAESEFKERKLSRTSQPIEVDGILNSLRNIHRLTSSAGNG